MFAFSILLKRLKRMYQVQKLGKVCIYEDIPVFPKTVVEL